MNFKLRICLSAAFILLLASCGPKVNPISQKAIDEKPDEAVKIFESQYDYESLPASPTSMLCGAYLKLRDYKNYFTCIKHLSTKEDTVGATFLGMMYRNYGQWLIGDYQMKVDALIDTGQYKEALKYALECLRLTQDEYPDESAVLALANPIGAVAHCYALLGNAEKADFYLKKFDEIKGADNIYIQPVFLRFKYTEIVKVRLALGQYQKALDAMNEYQRKVDEDTSGGKRIAAATGMAALSTLAMVVNPVTGIFYLGNTIMAAGSEVFYRSMLQTIEWASIKFRKARCLYETGQYDKARKEYDDLLNHDGIKNLSGIYPVILRDRGRIAVRDGDVGLAEKYFSESIVTIETYRSTLIDDTSKIGFVNKKLSVYGDMISLLVGQKRFDEAFAYTERAKARALIDLLASRSDLNINMTEGEKTLVSNINESTQKMESYVSPEAKETQRGLFIRNKNKLETDSPEVASLVTVTSVDTSRIQSLLPADETLIEYYMNDDQLFAFVMTSEGISATKLYYTELSSDISKFRTEITNPQSSQYKSTGRKLYSKLIKPIEKLFAGRKLTIVSHGPMHYLPFEALVSGNKFLIDVYSIRLLPSASVLKFLKTHNDIPDNILAFGNPDLGSREYDLPGSQREVRSIAKEFSKSVILLRGKASKQNLIEYGAKYKYLHFATHGIYDPENPLHSGLFLAGDDPSQGMLTVNELYSLKLNADMVTLSACETGLGKVSNGEDVVGLTRGFLFAGSSTVIASLWQVDDRITAKLMKSMYDNLKHEDKRAALRDAQLKVKDKYKRHPYYWAAFQLTGAN